MDTVIPNREPDKVTDISRDGDVIFIVGPEEVRLRVNSECLRAASNAFDAMFKPEWSEGRKLSKELPPEIPLPEDDADAMRTICCIVHHRNDLVPKQLRTKEILQIAIEVDKYDLKVALMYASLEWLKPRANAEMGVTGQLLAATFLFGNEDAFMTHALELIFNYSGSYLSLLDDDLICQVIPPRIFHVVEERRTRARAEVGNLLVNGKSRGCKCGWGKSRSEEYGLILAEHPPLRMLETPMKDLVKRMEQVSTGDMTNKYCQFLSFGNRHEVKDVESLLADLSAIKQRAGISIDTIRTGAAKALV